MYVQEKVLDTFWDFLEPLVYNNNLLIKYDDFLKTQFGLKEACQVTLLQLQRMNNYSAHWSFTFQQAQADWRKTFPKSFAVGEIIIIMISV